LTYCKSLYSTSSELTALKASFLEFKPLGYWNLRNFGMKKKLPLSIILSEYIFLNSVSSILESQQKLRSLKFFFQRPAFVQASKDTAR